MTLILFSVLLTVIQYSFQDEITTAETTTAEVTHLNSTMEEIDYEREYSPHFWTDKPGGIKVLEDYIELIKQISSRVRADIPYEEMKYGSGEKQLVDIYGKDSIPSDADIMLFLHGGYWQLLDKNITAMIVHPMWKHGIRVFMGGFDLAPQVTVGRIIKEIQELGTFVMKYAKDNNVKKVWIVGHSVGSHLAASMLYSDSWLSEDSAQILEGMVLAAGIYDITPVVKTTHNNIPNMTLGQAEKWSPMLQKKIQAKVKDNFKVLVYVGDRESPEWIRQNREYSTLLKKQGVASEFHLLNGIDHFDIASNLQYEDFILTREILNLYENAGETSKEKE